MEKSYRWLQQIAMNCLSLSPSDTGPLLLISGLHLKTPAHRVGAGAFIGPLVATGDAPGETGDVSRMKESYGEDLASHTDPESCAATRKRSCEALTGTFYHLSTSICQIFTPSARPAHNAFGLHHGAPAATAGKFTVSNFRSFHLCLH
jgi:hypothetical protein